MSELREAIARAVCGAYARRTWPHAAPDVIDNWVNQSCRSFFDEADAALSAIEARGMVVGPRETYLAPAVHMDRQWRHHGHSEAMRPQDIPTRRETWRQRQERVKRETRKALTARRQAILAGLDCGKVLSAAEIGAMAGVSSRSVWREVERLRALGYEIRGEAGVGYTGRVGRPSDA